MRQKFERVVLNFLSVNCYLLWDEDNADRECLVVDPGSSENKIIAAVEHNNLHPVGILLTHAHVDHISAVPEIASMYNVPVWLHTADRGIYFSPDNALRPWMESKQGLPEPVENCPAAGLDFQIIHTPGHTPGGCCFYFPAEKYVLTGDTLFQGTYGRTDFPGGNEQKILASIRNSLLTLPEDVTVYPGHGPKTSIAAERANPVFM